MSSKSTFSNSTSNSYASALYELSKENSELDQVEDGMKNLNKLLKESPDFKEMILSPTVAKEDKKNVIFLIAGLIIQVGSVMVDTSIKTKLKKLEKNMTEA